MISVILNKIVTMQKRGVIMFDDQNNQKMIPDNSGGMAYSNTQSLNAYISKVFLWMFVGLALTAFTSLWVVSDMNIARAIVLNPIIFYGLMIGELILVIVLSKNIMRYSFGLSMGLFFVYAIINGLTFSVILLAYTGGSVVAAFATTSLTFGVMAVYGRVTKNDLTKMGSFLMMGLIGVLILSVVNIFLKSGPLGWIISIVGMFVFMGLTAYDMQKLKGYYYSTEGNEETRSKLGIMGALNLYLDFINLFLMLLRLGRRN